jgi:predicted dinucleotide-binding enzyme
VVVKVKLKKSWKRMPAGTVAQVGQAIADQLVSDGFAVIIAPKRGPKPTRTKVAKPDAVKG